MSVRIEDGDEGGVPVVRICGDCDDRAVDQLRAHLWGVWEVHREGRVIVDLTQTTYLDSHGLGILIGFLKLVRKGAGELRLVIPEKRIRRIFEVTGLALIFAIYPSVTAAVVPRISATGVPNIQ